MDPYGLTPNEWRRWAQEQGLPAFRGQQVFEGLHRQAPERFAELTALPIALRERLDGELRLAPAHEVAREESRDGTVKSLLELRDGQRVECVSIPTAQRHTVCVSSQAGCPVGCTFCASGIDGVQRNLDAGEIVYQVLHHHRHRAVSNVVYMGSGEPMFNYQAVLRSIAVLGDERGLGMGRRRFTVSTSGVPPRIRQLGEDEPQVRLALSLHAPDDVTRSRLVPLNRRWPITELMAAMDDYSAAVSRRITLEYVLLADANMSDEQALALAELAQRYHAHVNLIPFNPVDALPHRRPAHQAVLHFAALLDQAGVAVTVRGQRGSDIAAACGQLANRNRRPHNTQASRQRST